MADMVQDKLETGSRTEIHKSSSAVPQQQKWPARVSEVRSMADMVQDTLETGSTTEIHKSSSAVPQQHEVRARAEVRSMADMVQDTLETGSTTQILVENESRTQTQDIDKFEGGMHTNNVHTLEDGDSDEVMLTANSPIRNVRSRPGSARASPRGRGGRGTPPKKRRL